MDEYEKWTALIRSIMRAGKILNMDLTEEDIPEFLNWKAASDMHQRLWAQVYLIRQKNY